MTKLPRVLLILAIGAVAGVLMLALGEFAHAQSIGTTVVAATPNLVTRLTDMAFQILVPVVTLFAMFAAHKVIKLFETKTGFDVPDKQEKQIDIWIEQGIHLGEEKSRNLIKKHSKKLTGSEKLEFGAGFVLGFIEQRGWIGWGRDKIINKIEAKLGNQRSNGGKPRLDAEGSPDLPPS